LGSAVFDHPRRNQRGRTITHAYHYELGTAEAPAVLGSDDAAEARWIPIEALPDMEEFCLEDHFHILWHVLGFPLR